MMRTFLIILLVILSKYSLFACYFYPNGEDVRYSILKPELFDFKEYYFFNYTVYHTYGIRYEEQEKDTNQLLGMKENIDLWLNRCKNVPSFEDTKKAIYKIEKIDMNNSNNTFITYLQENDKEALEYLTFAKGCEKYNAFYSDPWERQENKFLLERNNIIKNAYEYIQNIKDKELIKRYAFLAIRLAFYNNDTTSLNQLYDSHFKDSEKKNIIDYWSLYFKTLVEKNDTLQSYYAALVFQNAPDKRLMVQFRFNNKIDINSILHFAKNNSEKKAVYFLASIKNPAHNIEYLKKLKELKIDERNFSFLLLREINKLEDWIFTPYYSKFTPAVVINSTDYNSNKLMKERIKSDREYADELLSVVNGAIDDNNIFGNIIKGYLHFMAENTSKSVQILNNIISKHQLSINLSESIKEIITLGKLKEAKKLPESNDTVLQLIMRNNSEGQHNQFLFTIAKELEYAGNYNEAAMFLSKLNSNNRIFYKMLDGFDIYRYDNTYFYYLNFNFDIEKLNELVEIVTTEQYDTEYEKWKFSQLKKDLPRLFDLIGTKYMRLNKLEKALITLKKVDISLWTSDLYPYKKYLDANPFFTNFYNEHKTLKEDSVSYTKVTLLEKLIEYINLANDSTNKDRDYYYFLVGNCYLNMTQYGNSWIMKRYSWSNVIFDFDFPDKEDYYKCLNAREYYLKAYYTAQSNDMKAFYLRMAGRCDKYAIMYDYESKHNYYYEWQEIFENNSFYYQIKEKYPEHYNELISNCESFYKYYNKRIREL